MKITIARALAQIRSIDTLFSVKLASGLFVAVSRGKGQRCVTYNSAESVTDVSARIRASFDSIDSLLARRALLKAAVVEANAAHSVTICDETMSVAAAIERRRTITMEREYLNTLRSQYMAANGQVTQLRAALDRDIDTALAQVYGNDKGKVDAAQSDAISIPKRDNAEPGLIDPMGCAMRIERLFNKIETFAQEIDFTLNEFNARTEIEVADGTIPHTPAV